MGVIQLFNKNFLSLVVDCYFNEDLVTLDRLHIPMNMAKRLAKLPPHVRHRLESQPTPFVDLLVNESAINSAINNCVATGERDEIYNRAIELGASKATMRDLCSLSSAEFTARRRSLGINEVRARPRSLSVDEEVFLNDIYQECDAKHDRLQLLITLSERSDIEINRIYAYYVKPLLERNHV